MSSSFSQSKAPCGFRRILIWLVLLAVLPSCGHQDPDEPASETETRTFDDVSHADSIMAWKVKAPAMSMWIDPAPKAQLAHNRLSWTLAGRVSKNLAHIRSFVAGRHHVKARIISARRFELQLTDREMSKVLGGEKLFIEFEPQSGPHDSYSAMVVIQPRFWAEEGTDRMAIERWLTPVLTSGGVIMRAFVDTEPGFNLQYVRTDDDQDPEIVFNPDWHWWVDWTPGSLQFASDMPDPVYFYIHDGADSQYRRSALLELRVKEAGLSILPPEDAWPDIPCERKIDKCLNGLSSSAKDTFECGDAIQVRMCLNNVGR